jgi:hypothetical protein
MEQARGQSGPGPPCACASAEGEVVAAFLQTAARYCQSEQEKAEVGRFHPYGSCPAYLYVASFHFARPLSLSLQPARSLHLSLSTTGNTLSSSSTTPLLVAVLYLYMGGRVRVGISGAAFDLFRARCLYTHHRNLAASSLC